MTTRIETMTQRLTDDLQPEHLEIIDDSADHIGHAGAQSGAGHYTVKIKADCFAGKNMVQQHQLVYKALGDMIPDEIHAVQIEIL